MRIQSPIIRAWFRDQVAFIVGSGPSMRLFDIDTLRGMPTIALNQSWRFWIGSGHEPRLSITVHPELILQYERDAPQCGFERPKMYWATKRKPPLDTLELDDPRHFVFSSDDNWDTFINRPDNKLFVGRGIHQTAMDLAARNGARGIVLVGVDMADLGGDHHGHEQHVQFHSLPPDDVYREYREWARHARKLLWEHWKVPVMSLSPFAGLTDIEGDYKQLCAERGLEPLPAPKDVSKYTRLRTDNPESKAKEPTP